MKGTNEDTTPMVDNQLPSLRSSSRHTFAPLVELKLSWIPLGLNDIQGHCGIANLCMSL